MADLTIPPHDIKRQLIEAILEKAQAASRIDERISLRACTPEKVREWYETTMPLTTDVETVWAAFRIELEMHYGEMVLSEGEQRGGDQSQSKLSQKESLRSHAEEIRRSNARMLAKHKPVVREYYKAVGKKATRRGALDHVRAVKVAVPSKVPPSRSTRTMMTAQLSKADAAHQRLLAELEKTADGQRRSDRELSRMIGDVHYYLQRVKFLPWLSIDRTPEGTAFTINEELRAICDDLAPRPVLDGFTVRGFLKHLRAEIVSRRKANKDAAHSARWNPDAINKREQSDLLDWVEDQLGRIPS